VRIYRSLRQAGVIERVRREDGTGWTVRLTQDVPQDFALNQALSPFAYVAFDLLDPEAPTYALDVISVVEATLENPRQVVAAQENAARRDAVAAMKAEGFEYEERMAALQDVTYPKPLEEILEAGFTIYRKTNPWAADLQIAPKSVVRDMIEKAMTFAEFVSTYQLARSEGVLLRYLADAYRTLRQTVSVERRNEELEEYIAWLGAVVRGTDSSLLDEWERLADPLAVKDSADDGAPRPPGSDRFTADVRALRVLVRNAMFRRVELVDREAWDGLAALGDLDEDGAPWTADRWRSALDAYFDEHATLGTGPEARSPELFRVTEVPGPRGPVAWQVRQVLDDPAGHHDWFIDARVDLAASDEAGELVLRVTDAGQL